MKATGRMARPAVRRHAGSRPREDEVAGRLDCVEGTGRRAQPTASNHTGPRRHDGGLGPLCAATLDSGVRMEGPARRRPRTGDYAATFERVNGTDSPARSARTHRTAATGRGIRPVSRPRCEGAGPKRAAMLNCDDETERGGHRARPRWTASTRRDGGRPAARGHTEPRRRDGQSGPPPPATLDRGD